MMNQSVIFGTITAVDENKNLSVELENGEKGVVTLSELGRRNFGENYPLHIMIGRRLGFIPGKNPAELSARRYEEELFEEIRTAFENRTRNVYPAELVSVTPTTAYYRIAQGVNGGVMLSEFAFAYTESFTSPSMRLPRQVHVVIKQITENGRIDLSMRPAFGDFDTTVNRLGLSEGCEFEAPVISMTRNGHGTVAMLAPNLTVLSGSVPVGDVVKMRCTAIQRDLRRLRTEVISSRPGTGCAFNYDSFLIPAQELGDYVDLDDFDARVRPVSAAVSAPKKDIEIDFSIPANTYSSPFAVEEGETVVHERRTINRSGLNHILESGALDDRYRSICRAVCDLRYSNMYLIQHYLSAKHGLNISTMALKSMLTRLVDCSILSLMHFQRDGGARSTPVYVCGNQYRNFMSTYPRLQAWEYSNTDASIPKTRLCSNQLLVGLMHSRCVTEHEPHPYIIYNDGTPDEIRVRPRHRLVVDGKLCYLEGVRSNWEFRAFADKLKRYQAAFDHSGEKAEVLVAVETREIAQQMAERVERELALGYTVRFCADLDALPEPQFVTANPTRAQNIAESDAHAGFINRLKHLFISHKAIAGALLPLFPGRKCNIINSSNPCKGRLSHEGNFHQRRRLSRQPHADPRARRHARNGRKRIQRRAAHVFP